MKTMLVCTARVKCAKSTQEAVESAFPLLRAIRADCVIQFANNCYALVFITFFSHFSVEMRSIILQSSTTLTTCYIWPFSIMCAVLILASSCFRGLRYCRWHVLYLMHELNGVNVTVKNLILCVLQHVTHDYTLEKNLLFSRIIFERLRILLPNITKINTD